MRWNGRYLGDVPTGFSVVPGDIQFFVPWWDEMLWGFDIGPMKLVGCPAYSVAFPLWCLILPLLIPPTLFMRRRRGERRRGFPLLVDAAPAVGPHPDPPPKYQGRG